MQRALVIVCGVGNVGRAFLRHVASLKEFHAREYSLSLGIHAVVDQSGAVVALHNAFADGFSNADIHAIVQQKSDGKALSDWLGRENFAVASNLRGAVDALADFKGPKIIVDCSASPIAQDLLYGQAKGFSFALANKKPLTESQESYDLLMRGGSADGPKRNIKAGRWESTVGAAMPINATLARLNATGDFVNRIVGTFSGTLGYVMSGLQKGLKFSEVVLEAHRLGYTEPDPRDDLGGVDVARKALILARGMGWTAEMSDLVIEPLYPEAFATLSVPEFLSRLPELDEKFSADVESAASRNEVLRYVASLQDGKIAVGMRSLSSSSPIGRLSGTDNMVEFHTKWYNPSPLVLQGSGAGGDITASGVLSDVVELALIS
eukprot:TRINITY_DN7683_c0_g1_i1.p1 TRINITY_DN7683_c0_g1~~TRINITY_DN7683_c0_g1_i1.p1  ORF type:complete len:378 (+),score=91.00 TRINITY_DN7683_c0_g1_i1:47-1180(+)